MRGVLLDAPPLDVRRAPLLQTLEVLVKGLAVAERNAGALAIIIVGALCRRQDLALAAAAGHGVGLSTGVADHGGQLPAPRVDEPVGDLVCWRQKN